MLFLTRTIIGNGSDYILSMVNMFVQNEIISVDKVLTEGGGGGEGCGMREVLILIQAYSNIAYDAYR